MDDRTERRPIDQLAGDGWILRGGVRIGQVTYAINVYDVRTSHADHALTGTELAVRVMNHTIDASAHAGQLLTLALKDGRTVTGFISDDGTRLVRTGALV